MSEPVLMRLNGGPFSGDHIYPMALMPWPLPDALPDPELRGTYRKINESQLPPQDEGSHLMRGAEYEWVEA